MHTPVLLQHTIDALGIKPGGLYIDCTFGEGGHTKAILGLGGKVLGLDVDKNQISKIKSSDFAKATPDKQNFLLIHGNFKDIEEIAKKNSFYPVDGVLFDLGLSMMQLAEAEKGLSFKKKDEALDMRIDNTREYTAAQVLNDFSEEELYDTFAKYAEELHSEQIASGIVQARVYKKIEKVGDLIKIIDMVATRCTQGHNNENEKIYARIFQALRIIVNGEINNLKKGLEGATNILKKDGKICVISFHSVEDRVIKLYARQKKLKLLGEFTGVRSFERSARLRVYTM